jgi:Tfp pilus assembly protein PilN
VVNRINLVPAEQQRRSSTDVGLVLLIILVAIVIAGMVLVYFYFNGQLSDKEAELADLQAQNQQLEAQLAALAGYQELDMRRATLEEMVTTIYAGRTLVSEILGDLSLVIPENVWLTSLTATAADPPPAFSPNAQPTGGTPQATEGTLALIGNTYTFEDVATFLVRLEQINAVGPVDLNNAGPPNGNVDPAKTVRGYTVAAEIHNTQAPDTQLPMSQVEVEAQ